MKSILLPVTPDADTTSATVATAITLVKRFGAHLLGVSFAGLPYTAIGEYFTDADAVLYQERLDGNDAQAREVFLAAMAQAGLTAVDANATAPGFRWRDRREVMPLAVQEVARAFDVSIVGRPGAAPAPGATALFESLLFDSGRPVLVVPPGAPGAIGRRIAVAWNGSSETARTIAYAMPLLSEADTVTVIEVTGVGVAGPSAADIALQLTRHGLSVTARTCELKGRSSGAAFLEETIATGADLMIKGAYTQSRLRQMFFGGATAHLLANTTIPMLMAH